MRIKLKIAFVHVKLNRSETIYLGKEVEPEVEVVIVRGLLFILFD